MSIVYNTQEMGLAYLSNIGFQREHMVLLSSQVRYDFVMKLQVPGPQDSKSRLDYKNQDRKVVKLVP